MDFVMITFKRAQIEDLPLIKQLAEIAFPQTYNSMLPDGQVEYMMEWMYSMESLLNQVNEQGHIYYLVYYNGEAAGYFSLQHQGNRVWHLHRLYLLQKFQKLAVGKEMFKRAVEHIRANSQLPARMELNVNRENPAVGFYTKMGMYKASQGDFPIGNGFFMTDYIMALDII
jgi:ribosomal protein S18 acetylase RimI-like enzyme